MPRKPSPKEPVVCLQHQFSVLRASRTNESEEEEEDFALTARSVAWELIPFSAL